MDYNCKRCPSCKQETNIDNDFCPFCGQDLKGISHFRKTRKSAKRTVSILIILILAVNILPNIFMSRSFKDDVMAFLPKATVSSTFVFISDDMEDIVEKLDRLLCKSGDEEIPVPEPEPASKIFYDGTYDVGRDMPAGEYLLISTSADYYGSFDVYQEGFFTSELIGGDYFETNRIVTLNEDNILETENCSAVLLENADPSLIKENGTGMYKAGTTLKAGEYVLLREDDEDWCTFSVLSDSMPNYYTYEIGYGYFEENSIVDVRDGEYLILENCYMVPIDEAEVDTSSSSTFKVGTHIEPGIYTVNSDGSEEYVSVSIYNGRPFMWETESYVHSIENSCIVELSMGDYIYIENAYLQPYDESEIPYDRNCMLKVGRDIPSGDYALFIEDPTEYCFADVSYMPICSNYSIVSGQVFTCQSLVSLSDGQYIMLYNCSIEPLETAVFDTRKSGTFIVGTHIPAGEYTVVPDGENFYAYVDIYTDTALEYDICINSYSVDGKTKIELEDGQVAVFMDCHISE